jgi:RHS repeat-associated protein
VSYFYDGVGAPGQQTTGVGDGDLTQTTQYPGGGAAARVTQDWYDWRDRLVASKSGVQASENDGTHRPIAYTTYDNLGEATRVQSYDGDGVTITISGGVPQAPSASLLRAQTNTSYDDQGRVYQTQVFDVSPSTGAVSSTALTTNDYYDHRGGMIAQSGPGGLWAKSQYDGAGRAVFGYETDGAGGTTWSAAGSVSSDTVLEQTQTVYDADGNVIETIDRQRFHNASGTGPLGTPSTGIGARVYYAASYYDAADRLTAAVNVGTNNGSAWARPSTAPAGSDTVLLTQYGYAADDVQQVALTGSPTGGTFTLSFNGQTTSALAFNSSAAAIQSALQALSSIGTNNVLVAGPAGGPWQVRFVGSLGGTTVAALTGNGAGLTGGTSPSVSIALTSQGGDAGREQQVTDPRGLVTKTDYDLLGRTVRTMQAFTAFSPSNAADLTTEYTYDGDNNRLTVKVDLPGGAYQTTQYVYGVTTAGGSTVNSNDILAATRYPDPTTGNPSSAQQETYTVDALGERMTMQDRDGNVHTHSYDVLGRQTADAVTTLGAGVDGTVRRIQTAYDTQGNAYLVTSYDAATGGNVVNQVEELYNGLGQLTADYQSYSGLVNTASTPVVQYAYAEMAGGANNSRPVSLTYPNGRQLTYNYAAGLDSSISRLTSISDSSGTLESYLYLGLSTVVERDHPQTHVNLTYIKQGNDPNSNMDGGDQYTGVDRFGRVIDQNWYNTSTSASTDRFQYGYDRDSNVLWRNNLVNTAFGELYAYDNLNELTSFQRGTLNSTHTGLVGAASHSQSWAPDALGNFTSVVTDGSTQTRAHNQQNEITSISGQTTPGYDGNGNTTTDQAGHALVYDAWNRLVQVKSGSTTLATYSYDGLNRQVTVNAGTLTVLYYSSQWQVLEEQTGGVTQVQYVWSPVYVAALIERDRGSERLYAQQDANWNITALANVTGTVVERYAYDPYGQVTYLTSGWGTLSGSGYAWVYNFQGMQFDGSSGLYEAERRWYSPALARWMSLDPLGFAAGDDNLYRAMFDDPVHFTDPTGLDVNVFWVEGAQTDPGTPKKWERGNHLEKGVIDPLKLVFAGAKDVHWFGYKTGFGIGTKRITARLLALAMSRRCHIGGKLVLIGYSWGGYIAIQALRDSEFALGGRRRGAPTFIADAVYTIDPVIGTPGVDATMTYSNTTTLLRGKRINGIEGWFRSWRNWYQHVDHRGSIAFLDIRGARLDDPHIVNTEYVRADFSKPDSAHIQIAYKLEVRSAIENGIKRLR